MGRLYRLVMILHTSMPLISGSIRSSSTSEGLNDSIASSPLVVRHAPSARRTLSACNLYCKSLAMDTSSSMINIRFTDIFPSSIRVDFIPYRLL